MVKKNLFFQIILILTLLNPAIKLFSSDNYEVEYELEEAIQQKIDAALGKFLKDAEFYVIVDLKFTAKEKPPSDTRSYGKDLSDLSVDLPGVTPFIDDAPRDGGEGEREGEEKRRIPQLSDFKKEVSLYLNDKIPESKVAMAQKTVERAAQIDTLKGDRIIVRQIDFSQKIKEGEIGITEPDKQKEEKDEAKEDTRREEELVKTSGDENDKLVLYAIGALFVLFLFLLIIMLFRAKSKHITHDQVIGAPQPTVPAKKVEQPVAEAQKTEPTERQGVKVDSEKVAVTTMGKELIKQEIINVGFGKPQFMASVIDDWIKEENGLRDSAYLVKSFGLETITTLFSELDSKAKSKIYSYYSTVEAWKPEEEIAVLNKLKGALEAKKFQLAVTGEEDEAHFSFIKKMSDYQLFYLVKDEELPVIALLATYLPPERAAKLVAQLPEARKKRLAVEIGNINQVSSSIINAITKKLADKSLMIPKFEFYPGSGISALVSILDNLDEANEKMILNSVREFDADLAGKLKKAYFIFDDLMTLGPTALRSIIKEIPKAHLAAALVKANEQLTSKILALLPERKREMLNFDIEKSKNISAAEVEGAQKFIVTKVREMIKSGELDLDKVEKMPPSAPTPPPPPSESRDAKAAAPKAKPA